MSGAVALYLALLGLLGYRVAAGADPAVRRAAERALVVPRVEQRSPRAGGTRSGAAPAGSTPAPAPAAAAASAPAPAAAAPVVTRSS